MFNEISEPVELSTCVNTTDAFAVKPVVCAAEREPLTYDALTPVPLVPDVPPLPDEPLVPLEPDVPLVPFDPEVPLLPLVPLEPFVPLEPDVPDEPATAKLATVIFLVSPLLTIGKTSLEFGDVTSFNCDIF